MHQLNRPTPLIIWPDLDKSQLKLLKKQLPRLCLVKLALIKLTTLAFALCSSVFTNAQSWYEIEIIVFEHTNNETTAELETWPTDLDLDWPSPLLELEASVSRPEASTNIKAAFEELPTAEKRLNNDAYAVRVRDPYRLLWHKAWRAPLLDEDKAPWILVQADEKIGDHYRLEGGIQIYLSRYLHLNSNLWLTDVSGPATFGQSTYNQDPPINNRQVSEVNINGNTQNLEAQFDWSQLPKPVSIRWACNYIEEIWPQTDRTLPSDSQQNPNWFYPFGCDFETTSSQQDSPIPVSMALSNQDDETELRKNYSELFANETALVTSFSDTTEPLNGAFTITEASQPIKDNTAQAIETDIAGITGTLGEQIEGRVSSPDNQIDQIVTEVRYPVSRIIHISDSRRMRSAELHYIDHPKIGILTIIHPVEKP